MNYGIGLRVFLAAATILIGTQAWAITDSRNTMTDRARAVEERAKPARLEVTVLRDPTCTDCMTFDGFLAQLGEQNVTIAQTRTLDVPSAEADALLMERGITRIPALVITGEIGKHAAVRAFLDRSGGALAGDVFVANAPGAPYVNMATKEVVGRMRLLRIVDRSCAECYDVGVHDTVLRNYGVVPVRAETVDVGTPEGRTLRTQYRITDAPTFVLIGALDAYPNLAQVWASVGTRESDGAAVFRKSGVAQMGTYRNLTSGKIIRPTPPPPAKPAQ